jgi:uncharacterized protein (TIGR03083 family)
MGMQLNRESFEDLIGAYALDACDDAEMAAVDAYINAHPDAAAEVERMRAAAAWLGASGPLVPPPNLRASLLDRVVVPASGVDAYTEVAEEFAAEIASLPPDARGAVTFNGLTVHELVGHLGLTDEIFLDAMTSDAPKRTAIDAAAVEQATYESLDDIRAKSFDDLFREWQHAAAEVRDAAPSAAREKRTVLGYSLDDALVIRAFETWTHLDDVRDRIDRAGFVPSAATLRSMADLSIRVVPFALAATGRAHPGTSMRIVLTGPGGGSWDVPLAPGEPVAAEPETVLTVDIVDWCHRFADRIEPDVLAFEVDGESSFAADVVAAAPVFTGL